MRMLNAASEAAILSIKAHNALCEEKRRAEASQWEGVRDAQRARLVAGMMTTSEFQHR